MVVRIGQKGRAPRAVYFREWRKRRGLTQDQLAERLGATKGAISKLERGGSVYNQSSLEALAEALECQPWELLAGPPDKKPTAIKVAANSIDEEWLLTLMTLALADAGDRAPERVAGIVLKAAKGGAHYQNSRDGLRAFRGELIEIRSGPVRKSPRRPNTSHSP